MSQLLGLVAYPAQPASIGTGIRQAVQGVHNERPSFALSTWEENDIAGRFVVGPILESIEQANILVADITRLNFNVVFEIGYAIGKRRRAFLIRNSAITGSDDIIREVGIFDTLGYAKYSNSHELVTLLRDLTDFTPLPVPAKVNTNAPVFLVLPRIKTDVEIRTVARVKKARLEFRSYDPEEHGRLAAGHAIESVAQSHGVICVLLSRDRIEAEIHNYRTALVAGLTLALEKELLLLQDGDDPVPLDFRDLVRSFRFPDQIDHYVADFATAVGARFQSSAPPVDAKPKTFLERLTIGASSAENEFQELGYYYLETDEFRRALRGEVRVVAGRKGSGKTALFAQLRDKLRQDKTCIVLDLKPEGFQLLKFKERVLDYLEEGTKEHTVTAFWEYLLLLEICHKLLEKDQKVHVRDHRLFDLYRALADSYYSDDFVSEGDFAERMVKLTQRIADDFGASPFAERKNARLTSGEITELLYKHDVAKLREDVTTYLAYKKALWILFDNLDKGWPAHGLTAQDIVTLRSLIDAMFKIERELGKREIECHGVVFIRNDVYELLIDNTPDRGKVASITLDWTDPGLLRELLRRRFLLTGINSDRLFEDIWRQICVSHIRGEETSQYLIDRCLMRPRSLIELFRYCRGHAVNLKHKQIEVADIEQGEEAYSSELLNNIDYEIRDVFRNAANVLYEFVESKAVMSGEAVREMVRKSAGEASWEGIFDLLLWYGFLGLIREDGEATYIHSVKYDIRRLKALIKKKDLSEVRFRINPAFWRALEVHP
jgi:hypothetical protein